tara:strand:- start:1274 stop:1492 length:219 start_codon:yes stop_codon:yes gene_type:complete
MNAHIIFLYAGPVIGAIAWNASASLVGVICVYLYLHRDKLRKYRLISFLTRPFHNILKRIAKNRLSKSNKSK